MLIDINDPEINIYQQERYLDKTIEFNSFVLKNFQLLEASIAIFGPVNQENWWKHREWIRIELGDYRKLPPAVEEVIPNFVKLHYFPHISAKDPTQLAYTQNPTKGKMDLQTRCNPTSFFASAVTEDNEQIKQMSHAWNGHLLDSHLRGLQVVTYSTPLSIMEAYKHGPRSCMNGTPMEHIIRHRDTIIDNPTFIYGTSPHVHLMGFLKDERVQYRVLFNSRTMCHSTLYPTCTEETLRKAIYGYMAAQGYNFNPSKTTIGETFDLINHPYNTGAVMPYCDGTPYALVCDTCDKVSIAEYSDSATFCCQEDPAWSVQTDGIRGYIFAKDRGYCEWCEAHVDEDPDNMTYSNHYEFRICSGCEDNFVNAYTGYRNESMIHYEDATNIHGGYLDYALTNNLHMFPQCSACEEYFVEDYDMDECVVNEGAICEDCTIKVGFNGEFYSVSKNESLDDIRVGLIEHLDLDDEDEDEGGFFLMKNPRRYSDTYFLKSGAVLIEQGIIPEIIGNPTYDSSLRASIKSFMHLYMKTSMNEIKITWETLIDLVDMLPVYENPNSNNSEGEAA